MRCRTGWGPDDWSDNIPGAVGRVTHSASGIHGGPIVVPSPRLHQASPEGGQTPRTGQTSALKAGDPPKANGRPKITQTCGHFMPQAKAKCARSKDHGGDHKSRDALDWIAERRRRP